ncbi:MAG: macro domain-containing protein [Euryarchaeota archaeon]|nr:macro domain-containing protein [Euryarchaeota archaeon]
MEILKELDYNGVKIQIVRGDITEENVDAIVNAANRFLRHGGGVAGAIVRAGGEKIQEESDEYVRTHGPLRTGEAVITSGGRLKAKYVIHTVGPVWRGQGGEDSLLYDAVFNALLRACEVRAKSVSMPAISTGIYGFPKERAVPIFARAIKDFIDTHGCVKLIRICNIDYETAKIFAEKFEI